MSEEDLEVLITLDDPEDPEKEDTFHKPQTEHSVAQWRGPEEEGEPTSKQK